MISKGDRVVIDEKPDKNGKLWFEKYKNCICEVMEDQIGIPQGKTVWYQCDIKLPNGEVIPMCVEDLRKL